MTLFSKTTIATSILVAFSVTVHATVYTSDTVVEQSVLDSIQTAKNGSTVSFNAKEIESTGFTSTNHTSHDGEGVTNHAASRVVIGERSKTEKITVARSLNNVTGNVLGISAFGRGNTEYAGSTVEVNTKDLILNLHADNGVVYGIYSMNASTDRRDESGNMVEGKPRTTKIVINAENTIVNATSGIKDKASGIVAFSEGEIEVNGNLFINADKAIVARGKSIVNINQGQQNTVVLNGDISFDFDAPTSGTPVNAVVNVNLTGEGSSWTGNTVVRWNGKPTPEDVILNVEGMHLILSDEATWTPTITPQDSTTETAGAKYVALNNLSLNNGNVNIKSDDIEVTVESLDGTGSINLATDGTTAGKFNVEKALEGAALDVKLKTEDLKEDLTADEITAEAAKELLKNVGTNEAGESIVKPTTDVKEGFVTPGYGVNADGETKTASANTLMQSSLELASAAPLALNRIMMNDVRKRLGDIRTTTGTHGAWVRYDGGKLSGEGGLENDFHTIQVGIDTEPSADAPRVGVAFSYTDSDSEYARGSAEMQAYSLAMYGTWMADNGQFFDLIGRMGTASTDMVVDGKHKGSMDNLALSVSGEFGWRFDVTDSIYVEPQAEVSYTYVNGDSLSLSTANYDIDSVHSLLGRVGFAAGMKCPNDYGNVYVRASAVHEFLGDSKITGVNAGKANVYEIDGQDTWFEYGIGANFNVTKSTYMWADIERTSGGALDEDWRATVGVRYAW